MSFCFSSFSKQPWHVEHAGDFFCRTPWETRVLEEIHNFLKSIRFRSANLRASRSNLFLASLRSDRFSWKPAHLFVMTVKTKKNVANCVLFPIFSRVETKRPGWKLKTSSSPLAYRKYVSVIVVEKVRYKTPCWNVGFLPMSSGNFSTSTAKTLQLQKSTQNDGTPSGLDMTRRCVFLGRHGFEGIWKNEDRRVPKGANRFLLSSGKMSNESMSKWGFCW